jgi:hypothetical protein
VLATGLGLCGLATCFGASTVTVGSWEAEPVVVCDTAGPHSKTVDKVATAEGATKLDDNLMAISSRGRTCRPNACALQPIAEIVEISYWGLRGLLPMTAIDLVAKENADYSSKDVAMSDFGASLRKSMSAGPSALRVRADRLCSM